MGLNIKNAQVEASIRALAVSRGVSLTDAIHQAVSEAVAADAMARVNDKSERRRAIRELVEEVRAIRGPNASSAKAAMDALYDERGLPA